MKREIQVVIKPDGTVEMKTHGFKGAECEAELKEVEKAIGPVKSRNRTKEYYEQPAGQKNKVTTGSSSK